MNRCLLLNQTLCAPFNSVLVVPDQVSAKDGIGVYCPKGPGVVIADDTR